MLAISSGAVQEDPASTADNRFTTLGATADGAVVMG